MIVMAGSFKRYGVPARPGKSDGKVCRVVATLCYDGYSTSGRRSNNRHPRSQSTRSRGRLMRASHRIVKTRSRAVCRGSGICLVSGCPAGTFDNSPAIHRWVPGPGPGCSPAPIAAGVLRRSSALVGDWCGTEGLVLALLPSDKSLGYSHEVSTGQCPKFAVKTDVPTLHCKRSISSRTARILSAEARDPYSHCPCPQRAARYSLPTTGYFGCGGSPQSRFRFVSKQNVSLTFEKEKQSCTDL